MSSGLSSYWEAIDAQLERVKAAKSVDDILAICTQKSSGDGFWGGDGDEMLGALYEAGWKSVAYRATYHWCVKAPDGSLLTYVEGDLYRGDSMPREDHDE